MGTLEAQGWQGIKLYVEAKVPEPAEGEPTTVTVPLGEWNPGVGEPVNVSHKQQHLLGWEVEDGTGVAKPIALDPSDIPDGVIGPSGTAFKYAGFGDPAAGGENHRDVGELCQTVLAGLKEQFAAPPAGEGGLARGEEGEDEDRPQREPIPRTFPKHKGKGK